MHAIEAWTNGIIGFLLSWILMTVWLTFDPDPEDSLLMVVSFSGLTVLRSYLLRIYFHADAVRRRHLP